MIGVVEYENSVFINDLLKKIGKPFQWIQYRQLPTPFFNDYKVIIDRLSLQNEFLSTTLKIQSMNNAYVINNPFSCDVLNKGVDMSILNELNIPHPKTFILPSFVGEWDLGKAISKVNWEIIVKEFSFPIIMKPLMGWGWRNVFEINSIEELKNKYEEFAEKEVMVVQEKIIADTFLRVFCVGKEKTLVTKYLPAPLGAGKIVIHDCSQELIKKVSDWSLTFCKKVDLDFNVVEWAVRENKPFVIDAYNPIPDVSEKIPKEYYNWIVNELASFVNKIYEANSKNKKFF
ncbi:MAG: hypothetical protein GON13_02695 [Nanoarchaeota archaeon]|nr:hypothetical protein [Nanoarchaeota archaeon]